MPEFGAVGGGIGAVTEFAGASVVQMQANHKLADGQRVRLGPPGENGASALYYVKCSGFGANEFAVYKDFGLKVPAAIAEAAAGMEVTRLAAQDWAVVAGINNYSSYKCLEGAVGDARRFVKWLKTRAYVPDDQVMEVEASPVLPVPPDEPRPQLHEVQKRFEYLGDLASKADLYYVGRRLYIFLSGHGIIPVRSGTPNYDESALLMANASESKIGHHIAGLAYAEWFRAPGVFDEVVLFMDCCRDWRDDIGVTRPLMGVLKGKRPEGRRFYVLATQLDSKAWERPFGTPPEKSGVFSHVLLEALNSPAIYDDEGRFTGSLLAARLVSDMWDQTKKQIPDPIYSKERDIIFAQREVRPKIQLRVKFDPSIYGKRVELYGKKYPTKDAEQIADNQPWIQNVDPFNYIFKIPDTGQRKWIEVDGKDEVVNVDVP